MWYGAMGTWQILLFALIAIKIKSNCPGAHTFPEIILSRHGKIAHVTYLFFGLATNMLVGACLVLGGAQVNTALSGVNVYAACFLIPFVVAAYVISGGLRSTFIADYTHTLILFIAIFVHERGGSSRGSGRRKGRIIGGEDRINIMDIEVMKRMINKEDFIISDGYSKYF